MNYRVYIARFGEVLTGVLSEEEFDEAMTYREFFQQNDDSCSGSGMYEVVLQTLEPDVEQGREIVARFTKEDIEFGYYGHEGWNPCISTHESDVEGTRVVFDTMIPYYIVKAEEYEDMEEEYTVEPDIETVQESIHEDDREFLEEVVSEERESRTENN